MQHFLMCLPTEAHSVPMTHGLNLMYCIAYILFFRGSIFFSISVNTGKKCTYFVLLLLLLSLLLVLASILPLYCFPLLLLIRFLAFQILFQLTLKLHDPTWFSQCFYVQLSCFSVQVMFVKCYFASIFSSK
jgi:hypothetical protein